MRVFGHFILLSQLIISITYGIPSENKNLEKSFKLLKLMGIYSEFGSAAIPNDEPKRSIATEKTITVEYSGFLESVSGVEMIVLPKAGSSIQE